MSSPDDVKPQSKPQAAPAQGDLPPMLGFGQAPQSAPQPSPYVDAMTRLQQQLLQFAEQVKAVPDASAPEYPDTAAAARAVLAKAEELMEQVPKEDAQAQAVRPGLLDAYFGLNRLLDIREGRVDDISAPQKRPERTAEQITKDAVRDVVVEKGAQYAPRRNKEVRRAILAFVALGIAIGVRLFLHFSGDAASNNTLPVTHARDGTSAIATNNGGKETRESVAAGAPVVSQVHLRQDGEGNLRTLVFSLNPHGGEATMAYRWFRNGVALPTEESGVIEASELEHGAAYHVEVTATAGIHSSPPIATDPVVVTMQGSKTTGGGSAPEGDS